MSYLYRKAFVTMLEAEKGTPERYDLVHNHEYNTVYIWNKNADIKFDRIIAKAQYLYISIDAKIKAGDWYLIKETGRIRRAVNSFLPENPKDDLWKIVASNDPTLTVEYKVGLNNLLNDKPIAGVPKKFISLFAEHYKDSPISEIEVAVCKYKTGFANGTTIDQGELMVHPNDNYIMIKELNEDDDSFLDASINFKLPKDMFSRKEMEELLLKAHEIGYKECANSLVGYKHSLGSIEKFIKNI